MIFQSSEIGVLGLQIVMWIIVGFCVLSTANVTGTDLLYIILHIICNVSE